MVLKSPFSGTLKGSHRRGKYVHMLRTANSYWVGRSHVDWQRIEKDIKTLAKRVQNTGFEFDKIATVSRGGLVPSRLMADYFNVKTILVDSHSIPPKTLFVDDIYDTGKTFKTTSTRFHSTNFVYATLVARRGKKYPRQLVYARRTKGKEYVVFPWEVEENKRQTKQRFMNSKKDNPKNN